MRRSIIVTLVAVVAIGAFATRAAAQNPYIIDGVLVPDATVPTLQDPQGNAKELGPKNGDPTKILAINRAVPPMLDFTNPNGQVDLDAAYLQTRQAANGAQWLYFGWFRDSNTGSGFISIEFQKATLSASCVYTGIDFAMPVTAGETALINNCNPWRGRDTGDFIILWDQQGNGLAFDDIKKRTFTCTGAVPRTCSLGPLEDLDTVVAAVSADGFRGEMAINLTDEIFGAATGCLSFTNVIPGTVTGNSDSADYKDTVFATVPPISNCGVLKVQKVTQDPNGNVFSDPNNPGFGYTVNRVGGAAIRFDNDAANHAVDGPATQTSIVRPRDNPPPGAGTEDGLAIQGGQTHTHTDLLLGSNYTLVETTPLPTPYVLVSVSCTDATGTRNLTPGTGTHTTYSISVPSGTFEATVCVITNRFVKTTPTLQTAQTAAVRLTDSVTITGLTPTPAASRASSVTFRLYSENTCTTLVAQTNATQTVSLSYNGAGTGATAGPTTAVLVPGNGTYFWTVEFPGDGLNNAWTTPCGLETTGVAITVSDGGPSGGGGS